MLLRLTGSTAGMRQEPAGLTFVKNRIGCPKQASSEIGFTADVGLDEGLRALIDWRDALKGEVEQRRLKAAS